MVRITTLACALLVIGGLNAQLITLHYGEDVVPSGSVVVKSGPASDEVLSVYLLATLNEAPGRTVNVKRYELSVQPETGNYFCWGVCYAAQDAGAMPYWAAFSQHALPMEPGVPLTNFAAYHEPRGVVGESSYRYVFYDMVDQTDSVWVDIVFNSVATNVHEQALVRTFNVFPNPSMGQNVEVMVELANTAQGTTMVVYDMLGTRLRTMRLVPAQNRTTLNVQDMAAGVYFATVEQGGRAVASRRFVVTH